MKKLVTLAAALVLAVMLTGFIDGTVYAAPVQPDSRKLSALTQKMNAMAQSISKEYAAATVVKKSVPSPDHALKPASGLSKEVVGYYTEDWEGDSASLQSVNTYGSKMSGIATFSFQVQADGQVKGTVPWTAIKQQRSSGGKALALVHNYNRNNFDRDLVHSVISSSTVRTQAIANILAMVRNNEFDGVNIDFENIAGGDRVNFNIFITQLAQALHLYGYSLTVSIPAKTFDDKTGWGGAFDYPALGKAADRVMLMTYDEHWFSSSPGAVASTPWVEKVINYAKQAIPQNKILLGIGIYGYDWAVSGSGAASALSSQGALQLISRYGAEILWDDKAQVPYFYYSRSGASRVVWFESNESAAFKLDMVNRHSLAGIAIWRLGFEADGFWRMVTGKFGQ